MRLLICLAAVVAMMPQAFPQEAGTSTPDPASGPFTNPAHVRLEDYFRGLVAATPKAT